MHCSINHLVKSFEAFGLVFALDFLYLYLVLSSIVGIANALISFGFRKCYYC